MNTNVNSHADNMLSAAGARSLVTDQQKSFGRMRGSAALAELVASGYVAICRILETSADVQAAILNEHGVKPAPKGASKFGPWIKVIWGEHHSDPSKTFTGLDGVKRRVWVPDRTMEVYFHTMEELERLSVNANHASVIIEHGGAQAMAAKRQQRLRDDAKPEREAEEQKKRDFFLQETRPEFVQASLTLPEGAGEFVTIACRRRNGGFELLGVVSKDATGAVTKLANERYDELVQAIEAREREARIREEAERAAQEKLIDADPELIRRMYAQLKKKKVAA